MYLFKWAGSKHSLILLLGFLTQMNELGHSDFSSIFSLHNMPSSTNFPTQVLKAPVRHVLHNEFVLHKVWHLLSV